MLLILKVDGGEGGIRTPDSLATMSDFESGAFNRALPPLRDFNHTNTNTYPVPPIDTQNIKLSFVYEAFS